ncbi:MAG: zf-HC2 domain-containing protein [bacterium]
MKCREIKTLFDDYILGELDSDTEIQMNEHMSECKECTEELAKREAVFNIVKSSARFEPSAENFGRIKRQIFIHGKQRRLFWIFPKSFVYAAAAFLLGIVFIKSFDVLVLKSEPSSRVETKYETRHEEPFVDTVEFYYAPAKNLAKI